MDLECTLVEDVTIITSCTDAQCTITVTIFCLLSLREETQRLSCFRLLPTTALLDPQESAYVCMVVAWAPGGNYP